MAAWRYEISLLVSKKYKVFQHEKRHFVFPRGHVVSSMYCTQYDLTVVIVSSVTCV